MPLKALRPMFLALLLLASASCERQDVDAAVQHARSKIDLGAHKEAVSLLDGLLAVHRTRDDAYNLRGVARLELEAYAEALSDFDKAISLNPSDYRYFYNRGNAKRRMNQSEAAVADYTQALGLDSTQYQVWFNRALANTALGQAPAAFADFEGALRNGGGEQAEVHFYLGKLCLQTERFESAVEALQTSVAIQPEAPEAYYLLALAQLGAGMPKQQACQYASRALEMGYEAAQGVLAQYCQELGQGPSEEAGEE
jgi:tetratricopeptide (TPR) repeat protein